MILLYDNKLREIKDNLQDTYCDNICDYNNGYICDIIMEISDNNVDIYNYNLLEWAKDNYSYIEDANSELGTPEGFMQQIQQGQYYQIEQDLYNNFENMILLYAYDYLKNNDIELTEEQQEELESELANIDNNNRLEDIIDIIDNVRGATSEE